MDIRRTLGLLALLGLAVFLPPRFASAQEGSLEELFKDMPPAAGAPAGSGAAHREGAAAGSPQEAPAAAPAATQWSLSGEQSSTYHLPILRDPLDYSGVLLSPSVVNELRLGASVGGVKMVSDWRVSLWPLGAPPTASNAALLAAGPAQITLAPRDNYLEVGSGTLFLQAGSFVDSWGAADGVNPTNNINPVDYSRVLAPESLPSLLVRAVYYPVRPLSLEGVFEPYKGQDLFPVSVLASIPASLFPSSEITVRNPPLDLASAVYGAKVTYYGAALDLSVSYLNDIDPYYTPDIAYTSYVDRSLTLVRKRIQRFGADAKSSIGSFGVWVEACYSLTQDPGMTSSSIRNPFLSWTAGSDVNYGPGGAFYLNFQYTGRYIFGYDRSFSADYPGGAPDPVKLATDPAYATEYYARALSSSLGDQTEGLLSGFILRSDFPLANGRWTPGLTSAYYLPSLYDWSGEIRYGSLVLEPRIDLVPSDAVTLTLGSQLIWSWKRDVGSTTIALDTADRIGMWHDQSNVYTKLDLKW